MPARRIGYEQAVYGSFRFRDRGYGMLAQSAGCRPEWLRAFQASCQKYGEPAHGVSAQGALFAQRLSGRVWMVVGVSPQGSDDRGRPGALGFHALFVSQRDLRKAALGPLELAGALRSDWSADTTALPRGEWEVMESSEPALVVDDLAARIAQALRQGRKVVLQRERPINDLARRVWLLGGRRVRERASLATLAFSSSNGFDLLAAPEWVAREVDSSYVREEALPPIGRGGNERWPVALRWGAVGTLAATALLLGVVGIRGWQTSRPAVVEAGLAEAAASASVGDEPESEALLSPVNQVLDSEERARVIEGLAGLAARFEVPIDPDIEADPSALMLRISARLRYPGPWLRPEELEALRRDGGIEAARMLEWHDHLRHFAEDRRLPGNFVAGPLPWQLGRLAWSFRVEPDPSLRAAEIPVALGEELSARWPARPGPLAQRFPALQAYSRFLSRLPRR